MSGTRIDIQAINQRTQKQEATDLNCDSSVPAGSSTSFERGGEQEKDTNAQPGTCNDLRIGLTCDQEMYPGQIG